MSHNQLSGRPLPHPRYNNRKNKKKNNKCVWSCSVISNTNEIEIIAQTSHDFSLFTALVIDISYSNLIFHWRLLNKPQILCHLINSYIHL